MLKFVVKILRKKVFNILLKKQKRFIIYYMKYEKGEINMDNKEFIEFIKKYGDIRPVREAFEKYPVEEEHQGKLESYLKVAEENAIYNNPYKIGDIVM